MFLLKWTLVSNSGKNHPRHAVYKVFICAFLSLQDCPRKVKVVYSEIKSPASIQIIQVGE